MPASKADSLGGLPWSLKFMATHEAAHVRALPRRTGRPG
jgi:hypothetical protein